MRVYVKYHTPDVPIASAMWLLKYTCCWEGGGRIIFKGRIGVDICCMRDGARVYISVATVTAQTIHSSLSVT